MQERDEIAETSKSGKADKAPEVNKSESLSGKDGLNRTVTNVIEEEGKRKVSCNGKNIEKKIYNKQKKYWKQWKLYLIVSKLHKIKWKRDWRKIFLFEIKKL